MRCEAAGRKMNCEENSIAQVTLTKAMPMILRTIKKGKTSLLSRGESEGEEREKLNITPRFLTWEAG